MPSLTISVLGSLNIDWTYRVPRIPKPGETITSHGVTSSFGGKGANQAIAAHRAGADVTMIGCLGSDDAGKRYLNALEKEGIETKELIHTDKHPTGSAVITVDDCGENAILVEPGANQCLTPSVVDALHRSIEAADALLMPLETPLDGVVTASRVAKNANTQVFINPSPWTPKFMQTLVHIDHLILNEGEAASMLGENAPISLQTLEEFGCQSLIITRGNRSTLGWDRHYGHADINTFSISPVDTVGAGDSFAGAYAVARMEQLPFNEAIRFANAAGALATQHTGAQEAIPGRESIEQLLAEK